MKRDRNRELARQHMPEFLTLVDQLKAAGMEPKVVHFEIYPERVAA